MLLKWYFKIKLHKPALREIVCLSGPDPDELILLFCSGAISVDTATREKLVLAVRAGLEDVLLLREAGFTIVSVLER